jgi:hypothetical protein
MKLLPLPFPKKKFHLQENQTRRYDPGCDEQFPKKLFALTPIRPDPFSSD